MGKQNSPFVQIEKGKKPSSFWQKLRGKEKLENLLEVVEGTKIPDASFAWGFPACWNLKEFASTSGLSKRSAKFLWMKMKGFTSLWIGSSFRNRCVAGGFYHSFFDDPSSLPPTKHFFFWFWRLEKFIVKISWMIVPIRKNTWEIKINSFGTAKWVGPIQWIQTKIQGGFWFSRTSEWRNFLV